MTTLPPQKSYLRLARESPPEQFCGLLGGNPPLHGLVREIIEGGVPGHHRDALLRALLKHFPMHPEWDEIDASGGPSIETVLLTVRDLRWDLREEEEELILAAVRRRPGREGLSLPGGIVFAEQKPTSLGMGSWSETIRDSDLSQWKPTSLRMDQLCLEGCRGPLELRTAMAPVDPDTYRGHPVLEVSPDLEVRNSAPSLEFGTVSRTFSGGWKAEYYLPKDCQGWAREMLDPTGMDLSMPVIYSNIHATEQLCSLPMGAVTTIRWGTLPSLTDGWQANCVLELQCLENLETLPGGFQIHPQPLSERCNSEWTRFPDHSLQITDCPKFRELPENLNVPIGLSLEGLPMLTRLPGTLRCPGALNIERCAIQQWPTSLAEFESLSLNNIPIPDLPTGLNIREDLSLDSMDHLEALPPGLVVGGQLSLDRCRLDTLPADLQVGHGIRIYKSECFTGIPFGLSIKGDFWCHGLPRLAAIPPGLEVGGSLLIWDCEAFELVPTRPNVTRRIHLKNLPAIQSLPSGFTARDDLHLENLHALRVLPPGLHVRGDLSLEELNIHSLPGCMQLMGGLGVRKLMNLVHWPKELNHIHGDLHLEFLGSLSALPENLVVDGRLIIRDCPSLKCLPVGLRARTVECSKELAESANPPLSNWTPSATDEARQQEMIDQDPLLQVFSSPGIQQGLASLAQMALMPEFKIMGRFLDDNRYEFYLRDWSGHGNPDRVLKVCDHANSGYRSSKSDFILAPGDLDSVHRIAMNVLLEWGFSRRNGFLTYVTEPEQLKEAFDLYPSGLGEIADESLLRPYHIHMDAWRKHFHGGGIVIALGSPDDFQIPPPCQIILQESES